MSSANDISKCLGTWYSYSLSADARALTLEAEAVRLDFGGIEAISIRPSAYTQQLSDHEKELRTAVHYRLRDCRVPAGIFFAGTGTNTVEIGPSYLSLRFSTDWKRLKQLQGFHLEGDYFSVTLICRTFTVTPLSEEHIQTR